MRRSVAAAIRTNLEANPHAIAHVPQLRPLSESLVMRIAGLANRLDEIQSAGGEVPREVLSHTETYIQVIEAYIGKPVSVEVVQ